VSVGLDGFFGTSTPEYAPANPYLIQQPGDLNQVWGYDALCSGQDFVRNNNVSAIDITTMHVYPDNYFICSTDCSMDYGGPTQFTPLPPSMHGAPFPRLQPPSASH
jgi:hypothetical protein